MAKKDYFQTLAQKPENKIQLAEAALQIAVDEYPGLDLPGYIGTLKEWAIQLRKGSRRQDARWKMAMLHELLFQKMRFSGNLEDYYDPKNSYLNDVMDRRKGIPISLSVIYLDLAWRIGLRAEGIGFPGHFLVRVFLDEGPRYVDPFHSGNVMTEEDCIEFWNRLSEGEVEFQESFLSSINKREILTRMLRNLKSIYLEKRSYRKVIPILNKLIALSPDALEEVRDRGIVLYQMQNYKQAMADFQVYLSMAPDAEDAETIQQYLTILNDYASRLN